MKHRVIEIVYSEKATLGNYHMMCHLYTCAVGTSENTTYAAKGGIGAVLHENTAFSEFAGATKIWKVAYKDVVVEATYIYPTSTYILT